MISRLKQFIQEHVAELAFGGLVSSATLFMRYVKRKFKEQEYIKLGLQAILRNDIIGEYNKWMEKEYLPIYARDNIENMYQNYHNLAVNGVITGLYEKLMELPTEKEN